MCVPILGVSLAAPLGSGQVETCRVIMSPQVGTVLLPFKRQFLVCFYPYFLMCLPRHSRLCTAVSGKEAQKELVCYSVTAWCVVRFEAQLCHPPHMGVTTQGHFLLVSCNIRLLLFFFRRLYNISLMCKIKLKFSLLKM